MFKPTSDDHALTKFQRNVAAGEHLFKEGDMGNTIFILLDGTVELYRSSHGVERQVGTLAPGEIIGEKAIVKNAPYKHSISARAKTEALFLEFDAANFKVIQSKIPDFAMKVIKILSERLDDANALISILQSTDHVDRVIDYLVFYSERYARKVQNGAEILLKASDMQNVINMTEEQITAILRDLVESKVLIEQENGYLISDKNALVSQISEIKERLAA